MWVLTRNRPTGPRHGTTVLVMGFMSLLLAGGMLVAHFAIAAGDATPVIIVLVRVGALLFQLGWAAFTVAVYREERRSGVRTYAAKAGLAILTAVTVGAVAAMTPGLVDSIASV
jgi:hypothetical protein